MIKTISRMQMSLDRKDGKNNARIQIPLYFYPLEQDKEHVWEDIQLNLK